MVVSRPNRQPRDWHKKTQARSHGGMLKGRQAFGANAPAPVSGAETSLNALEVTLEAQAQIVQEKLAKTQRQIDNFTIRLRKLSPSSEEFKVLDAKRTDRDRIYKRQQFALLKLEERIKEKNEKQASRAKNIKADELRLAIVREKQKPILETQGRKAYQERLLNGNMLDTFNPVPKHVAEKLKPKQKIVNNGGKRKVIETRPPGLKVFGKGRG